MRRKRSSAPALLATVCGAALLAGCGSSTKTVTVSSNPPVTQPPTTSPPATSTPTTTTKAPTDGQSAPTGSTRSAPEPAFTQEKPVSEGESAAAALVRSKGFTPNDSSEYHSNQALRVLLATRTGSGDGYGQQAFFFVNGRYIGTDAKAPSATLRLLSQSDTEVTLSYPLYRKNDPLCCPGGGQASVRFQLNNGRLTALDPIPPADRSSGLSRQ
jgi:LppP/LprE lipoprotein